VSVDCAGAAIAQEFVNTGSTAFSPNTATLSVGDIIKFTPSGPHDLSDPGGAWGTTTGEEGCLQFNAAGSFDFVCSVHPAMTGTITVQ
jgi:plastocyanin